MSFIARRSLPPLLLPRVGRRYNSSTTPSQKEYEYILTSTPRPGVAQITLNRPKALNALNTPLMRELNDALKAFAAPQSGVGAVVLTGNEKAFAAGADIMEMKDLTFAQAFGGDFIKLWSEMSASGGGGPGLPLVAAVNGYALGGGCELALMADVLYCGPGATFGQPEIKLGVIPGAGGSQRLTRAVGKARAMELILTGRTFGPAEAERWGVAARTFASADECLAGALDTAQTIAGHGRLAVKAAKEAVDQAFEGSLAEGLKYERRLFHGLFATSDQKIGMAAFASKTKPKWSHE